MILDFLQQHIHEKLSAFLGGGVAVLAPGDIVSKIIVGTTTGVLIWIITKSISWLVQRLKKNV